MRGRSTELNCAISYSVAWIALALRFLEVTSDITGNTDTSRSYTIHTIRAPYRHRPAPSRRAPATSESAIWLSDSVGLPGWPAAPSSPSLRRNCLHQSQCGGADTFLRGGDHFQGGAEHRAVGAATAAETAKSRVGCRGHRALETNFSRRMPAQKYPDRSVEILRRPRNARAGKTGHILRHGGHARDSRGCC